MRFIPSLSFAFMALVTTIAPAFADETNAPAKLTAAEQAAGWKYLFDGSSTEGWRNYRKDKISDGWSIVDGALTRTGNAVISSLLKSTRL